MNTVTYTRQAAGYYFRNDSPFAIVRRDMVGGWVFFNSEDNHEGGDDVFSTLKEAKEALESYIRTRHYVKGLGWCASIEKTEYETRMANPSQDTPTQEEAFQANGILRYRYSEYCAGTAVQTIGEHAGSIDCKMPDGKIIRVVNGHILMDTPTTVEDIKTMWDEQYPEETPVVLFDSNTPTTNTEKQETPSNPSLVDMGQGDSVEAEKTQEALSLSNVADPDKPQYHPEAAGNELALLSSIAAEHIDAMRYCVEVEDAGKVISKEWYETAQEADRMFKREIAAKEGNEVCRLLFTVTEC